MYRMTSKFGRAGMIVPTGIASDDTTKAFFAEIAKADGWLRSTTSRIGTACFRSAPKLPVRGAHHRHRKRSEVAFYATQVHELKDGRRRLVEPADFRLLNPNTRTCPIFRTVQDADLTKRIYRRVPVLIDESNADAGNPWKVSFSQGLFNMASDSALFLDSALDDAMPLYEAEILPTSSTIGGRRRSVMEVST